MDEERKKPVNLHTCNICLYGSSKSTFLMCNHAGLYRTTVKTNKIPKILECQFCGFENGLKVDFRLLDDDKKNNEKLESIFKCYRCKNCDFETHSILVLARHNSCKHGIVQDEAGSYIVENENLGIKWYKCKQSHHQTSHKVHIKQHLERRKHLQDTEWFQCNQCAYKGKTIHALKSHFMRKHTSPEDIKWVQCDQCAFQTKTKYELKLHMKRHMNPEDLKWFSCEQCTYRTKRKSHLSLHMRQHMNPEDINWFQCGECVHKTKTRKDLNTHITAKHLNPDHIQWFQCAQCEYKSKQKGPLKVHILRKHMNPKEIKWLQCQQCAFQSKTKGEMKSHIKIHMNPEDIEWFRCKQCSFQSKRKFELTSHMKRHMNREGIPCGCVRVRLKKEVT